MTAKGARSANIELVWPGKTALVRPEPLALVAVERNDASGAASSLAAPAWTNWLVHGDNARVLSTLMEGEFARRIADVGGIKLVYFDPPFGVGADFALDNAAWRGAPGVAYRDRWDESGLAGATSHLQWLFTRLTLARDILREDGVLYLHVDQRVSAHAKLILDEVFGASAFRGWIVWKVGSGAKARTRWSNEHNDILCYAKGDAMTFHTAVPSMREPFAETSRAMHFKQVDEQGRRHRVRVVNGKEYRYYEDEGRVVGSVWTDCPSMAANSPILAESTGWPTQKPESLLTRILESSTNAGDLVLELCAGSGTTPAVAEKLGRRWIAIDASAQSVHTTRKRLVRVQRECPPSKIAECATGFDVLRENSAIRPCASDARASDSQLETSWFAAVRDAYGATAAPPDSPWQGLRGDVPVAICARNVTADGLVIARAVDEAVRAGHSRLEILASEFARMNVGEAISAARARGVELALKSIPAQFDGDPFLAEAWVVARCALEGTQTRSGPAEVARVEARQVETASDPIAQVEIVSLQHATLAADLELAERSLPVGRTCIAYDGERVLQLARDRRGRLTTFVIAENWRAAIDAWGILAPSESPPRIDWIALRSRQESAFEFTTAVHGEPAHEIRVRLVDVFAREFDAVSKRVLASTRDQAAI